MKAKQRTFAFLLVLVLAAGAALALLTHANRKAEQAASEAENGSIPLLDVTGDTLEQVAVQYEGETLTLLPGDGWTLAEDPAYHLDDSACDTIRTALADMRAPLFLLLAAFCDAVADLLEHKRKNHDGNAQHRAAPSVLLHAGHIQPHTCNTDHKRRSI